MSRIWQERDEGGLPPPNQLVFLLVWYHWREQQLFDLVNWKKGKMQFVYIPTLLPGQSCSPGSYLVLFPWYRMMRDWGNLEKGKKIETTLALGPELVLSQYSPEPAFGGFWLSTLEAACRALGPQLSLLFTLMWCFNDGAKSDYRDLALSLIPWQESLIHLQVILQ